MCYGEIGTFRGFVIKEEVKVPLIEINGEIREMIIPIADNVKVGDKIMVYNSYNFDYEFKTVSLKSIFASLFKKLNIISIKPNLSIAGV
ncbi:conserved hypothetical protein [Methanocaldococcus sp. FS406-22]|uniref:hypothetical protein n=1 Tax=Methanocaldococcus sp. (strain FS406-22) TaxID=644281 RepID=UPI0001BF29F6|nr:hypothetical protein [Methanocaldococcus sp. FS406-22]ADC68738.1 conserved hypothetical protein [Methanocaldococcus sp. FS406-22]